MTKIQSQKNITEKHSKDRTCPKKSLNWNGVIGLLYSYSWSIIMGLNKGGSHWALSSAGQAKTNIFLNHCLLIRMFNCSILQNMFNKKNKRTTEQKLRCVSKSWSAAERTDDDFAICLVVLVSSACVAKPMSSASCSWGWLWCVETNGWTSACVAKPMSSASCSWWWLCYETRIYIFRFTRSCSVTIDIKNLYLMVTMLY